MNPTPSKTKGILITLAIVALGIVMGLYLKDSTLFRAAIVSVNTVSGTPGDGWSPLESAVPCVDRGNSTLSVNGGGGSYDWSVIPAGFNVLRVPGTVTTADTYTAAGGSMEFVSPHQVSATAAPKTFTVTAVPTGAVGGGQSFTVNMSPACVSRLDFINPAPGNPITPVNDKVTVNRIRATLTNGVTYEYDQSQIGNLELSFLQNPGAKPVGTTITVPFEHSDLSVDAYAAGDNIPPVHVPLTPGQTNIQNPDPATTNTFTLDSDQVIESSVEVYADNAGAQGDYLAPGVDYDFYDRPSGQLPIQKDFIRLRSTGAYTSGPIHLAYAYIDPAARVKTTTALSIPGLACQNIQTGLFEGRGQGFYFPQPGVSGSTGSRSVEFDMLAAPGGGPVTKLLFTNPIAAGTSFGSQVFQIEFDFVSGLSSQAVIASRTDAMTVVSVRDEGPANGAATAANFAYAVDSVLGTPSPFIAYVSSSGASKVVLYSTEVGTHTNAYTCSINNVLVASCFTGGFTGGGADPTAVNPTQDPPIPLNPTVNAGQSKVVYSYGGSNQLTWRSSDPAVLTVSALSATDSTTTPIEQLSNQNILFSASMQNSEFTVPVNNFFSTTNCTQVPPTPPSTTPTGILDSCDVAINAPVTFSFNPIGYPITIVPTNGSPVQGTVQGNGTMTGTLTGTATIQAASGGFVTATATLTGSVGGDAIGGVTGTVTMQVSIAPFTGPTLSTSQVTITSTTGTLSGATTLLPTMRTALPTGAVVTNFAIITGVKPGTATLIATDTNACTIPLDIQVLPEALNIAYADPNQASIVEPGDSVQLKANTGFAGQTQNDVTNNAGTTWVSDNASVATVTASGRVTAVAPGVANITARYTPATNGTTLTSVGSLKIQVNKLNDLALSLDPATIALLDPATKAQAFASAAVDINSVAAGAYAITLEGTKINLSLPVPAIPYSSELQRVTAIATKLAADINAAPALNVRATLIPSVAVGVVLLDPTSGNLNSAIDISTTAPADTLSILPSMSNAISLPMGASYGMQVVGVYDNGLTRQLSPARVTWSGAPLSVTSLATGRIERGTSTAAGTASVTATFTPAGGVAITSNPIVVNLAEQTLNIAFTDPNQAAIIEAGDSIQLNGSTGIAGGTQNDVTNTATWASDNQGVATVTATGRLTAVAPGVANITANFTPSGSTAITSKGSLRIQVNALKDMALSFDMATLAQMDAATRSQVFTSAILAINNSAAAGYSINLENQSIPLSLPVPPIPYSSELQRVTAIAAKLATDITALPALNVRATINATIPGVIILEPTGTNTAIDLTTSAPATAVSVLPSVLNGISIPVDATYGLIVLGNFDNGLTRPLNLSRVTWVANPAPVLDATSLASGHLKRATDTGTTSVYASFTPASGPAITSNTIAVNLPTQLLNIAFADPNQARIIEAGDSIQLNASTGITGGPQTDVTVKTTWTSDNAAVATVTAAGRLTAVTPGVANITGSYDPGSGAIISAGTLRIQVNDLKGLTISMDPATVALLDPATKAQAFVSAAVNINDPAAAGYAITLEGTTINLSLPVPAIPYSSDLQRITAIATKLAADINSVPALNVRATLIPNEAVGVVLLQPVTGNANAAIDITTSAPSASLSLMPSLLNGISLPVDTDYGLIAVGNYDNGLTRLLNPSTITWVANPATVLDGTALTAGHLKRALSTGTSSVYVSYTPSGGVAITSSPVTVNLPTQLLNIAFADPNQARIIEAGDSIQLNASTGITGGPQTDVTNTAVWASDNESVATVTTSGRLTAVAPGVANLTATYNPGSGAITSVGSLRVQVNKLQGLTLSLDSATVATLDTATKAQAFASALININDSTAAGYAVNLEGTTVALSLPVPAVPYSSELQRVTAIAAKLAADITALPALNVRATVSATIPGRVILQPLPANANAAIDITTTATAASVGILASVPNGITLPASDSYGLQVVGNYDNGMTRAMNFRDLTWIGDPVNRLNNAALNAGRLERGPASGTTSVTVTFTNPDTTVVRSNLLSVTMPSGPVINYVHILGSGAITKGSRVNMEVKVSDVDTIQDIQEIKVTLVKSSATTFAGIEADAAAIRFTVNPFLDQLTMTQSTNPPSADVTANPAPLTTTDTTATNNTALDTTVSATGGTVQNTGTQNTTTAASTVTRAVNYRTYTIPIEIPVDTNLYDGAYKLVVEISDAAGNTTNFVQPIFIGKLASGDVNGDGKINMLDVLTAYAISTGSITATPAQIAAGNLDNMGGITILDVLLLYSKVTNP